MGTTLTGTTPQDTYDSLIKVTDNGPLSGSLKTLTDGLGNDSALALSTGAASVTGTLAVSGNATFDTSTLVVDAAGDRVILGAAAALEGDTIEIHAKSNSGAISLFGRASDNGSVISFRSNGATTQKARIYGSDAGLGFATGTTQRVLIDSTGNVGIGTSNPTSLLNLSSATPILTLNQTTGNSEQGIEFDSSDANYAYIRANAATGLLSYAAGLTGGAGYFHRFIVDGSERLRITPNGVTFNGDTAAANALDDYEEGTFTATLKGSSSDPSTPVTTTANYTKIGRQVTVSVMFANVNTTGASGSVTVSGLPFSCVTAGVGPAITENFTFGLTRTSVSSFVDSAVATTIRLFVSGNDTSFENLLHNAGASRYLYISLTYFV